MGLDKIVCREIERMRKQLLLTVEKKGSLTNQEVVTVSQRLDQLIIDYYLRQMIQAT